MPGSNIQKNITRRENGRNVLDAKKSAIAALSWFSCDATLTWALRPAALVAAALITWFHVFEDWDINNEKLGHICVGSSNKLFSCSMNVDLYGFGLMVGSVMTVFGFALAAAYGLSALHRHITGDSKSNGNATNRFNDIGGIALVWTAVLAAGIVLYGVLSYMSFTKEIGLAKPKPVETSELTAPYVAPQTRYPSSNSSSDSYSSRYGSSSSSNSSSYPHPEVTYFDSDGRPCPTGTGVNIDRNTGDRTCSMSGK